LQAYVEAAKYLYTTAFFISSNNEALRLLCHYACKTNKVLGFNLSATFLLQFELANVLYAIEYADIVFGNEDEILAYHDAMKLVSETVDV